MNDIWNKTYRVVGITAGDAEVRAITAVSFHALTREPVAVCNLDIDICSGRTTTSVSVDITADKLDQLAARLTEAAQRAREMATFAAQLKQSAFPPVGSNADSSACAAIPPGVQATFSREPA